MIGISTNMRKEKSNEFNSWRMTTETEISLLHEESRRVFLLLFIFLDKQNIIFYKQYSCHRSVYFINLIFTERDKQYNIPINLAK